LQTTQPTPFYIFNASAGSGKTFTIVKKYLSLLFTSTQKDFYKNILAITFTNKAVAEMKSRIIETLRAFAEEETPSNFAALKSSIQQETGLSSIEIHQKSKLILESILHNYAAFEISTIDGFTHRVLRTFAKDLGIAVNFEVEMDTGLVLSEAVDRLIEKAGKDKELTQILIDFSLSKADDDKSWDIAKDLNDIAKLLINENYIQPLEVLKKYNLNDFKAFEKALKEKIKLLGEIAKAESVAFFDLINSNGLDFKDFSSGYIPKYFQKVIDGGDWYPRGSKWQQNIETQAPYAKKQTADKKAIMDAILPEIASHYRLVEKAAFQQELYNQVIKNLNSLSLLNAIAKEVELLKKERDILLISDFNKKISESVKNQPVPFIYERLGERYQDYFIDEFQDTSELQWNNLIPLISNSLSAYSDSGKLGSLHLVGDAKQSIYRWRGGKAEQFITLSAENEESISNNPFSVEKKVENLPSNWRSKAEVVDFNNSFFSHASSYLETDTYKDLFLNAAQHIEKKEGGYVQIDFIEAENVEEKNELYPQRVLELILDLENKGYQKEDICILVRKKSQGYAIAEFLNENEIPIISSETLLINQSKEVQFINHILQLSVYPQDDQAKFGILYYLWEQQGDKTDIFEFIHPKLDLIGQEFFDDLEKNQLVFNLSHFQKIPFYDGLEYLIRCFQLQEKSNAYLQFYLDFVYEFTQKNRGGVLHFLEEWELKKDRLSIVAPEGQDAVQIMTVHKSKGLEFPIVIHPYANEAIDDTSKDFLWVELEDEDLPIPLGYLRALKKLLDFQGDAAAKYSQLLKETQFDVLNVLYVAFTRAKNQLFILSELDLDKNQNTHPNKTSGILIDYLKFQNKWNDSLSYSFGTLINPQQRKEIDTPPVFQEMISSAPTHHDIDVVTKSGSLWGTKQEASIDFGNTLHEILNEITYKNDVEKALKNAVQTSLIEKENEDTYRKSLEALIHHPELTAYFSKEYSVFTEKEILYQAEFKRLDRLCIKQKEAVIIDYKTGDISPTHKNQINTYAMAVESLGFKVIKKILIYLEDNAKLKIVYI